MNEDLPPTMEYETSGEEYWSIARWPELSEKFDLKADDLPSWHDAMTGQGRAWEILRRLYRASPLVGNVTADDLKEWTVEDIAEKFSIQLSIVTGEIDEAVKHWNEFRATGRLKEDLSGISEEELRHLTRFSSENGMSREMISSLLKAFGFDHIEHDPVLRAEVASRIVSLKEWLNSPHQRTAARDLIRMEVSMHSMDKILVGYHNRLAKAMSEDPDGKDNSADIDVLNTKIGALEKQMRDLSKAHADKQETIGANDLDMTARKRIYVETVSYLVEQCGIYESNPENWPVDGVFTAREIDWLVEPSGERPPQYRFDIAAVMNDALLPENLWDPNYKPPKVTRRVCQELRGIIDRLRTVPADAPPLPDREDEDEDQGVSDDVAGLPIEDGDPVAAAADRPMPKKPTAIGVF